MIFEDLLHQESGRLIQFAMHLTRDCNDAKDLLQETLLKAISNKNNYSPGTNLRSWLFTIMKNSFINNYRRAQISRRIIELTDDYSKLNALNHSKNFSEDRFLKKDIDAAVNSLPNILRITFRMNAVGFKYHEIADHLDIPIGTVKTRIFLAKKHLKSRLHSYQMNYRKI